jgi:hypothetical protein
MPRKYIGKKKKTYDLSALMNAVDAVSEVWEVARC